MVGSLLQGVMLGLLSKHACIDRSSGQASQRGAGQKLGLLLTARGRWKKPLGAPRTFMSVLALLVL
jgi:hypothetical protein